MDLGCKGISVKSAALKEVLNWGREERPRCGSWWGKWQRDESRSALSNGISTSLLSLSEKVDLNVEQLMGWSRCTEVVGGVRIHMSALRCGNP